MARQRRLRLTTPKGIAKFPTLNTPNTRFNPDGEYSTSLLLDPNEHEAFLQELDALADEAFENAKQELIDKGKKGFAKQVMRQEPYKMELDQEGEETGMIEVKFKMKAHVKARNGKEYDFKPQLFDAKGKAIDPEKVQIYGGSEIKVNYTPNPYYIPGTKMAGVSLQLNAVQVIELVQRGGGTAESFGFKAEEGFAFDDHEDVNEDMPFDVEESNDDDDSFAEGADF